MYVDLLKNNSSNQVTIDLESINDKYGYVILSLHRFGENSANQNEIESIGGEQFDNFINVEGAVSDVSSETYRFTPEIDGQYTFASDGMVTFEILSSKFERIYHVNSNNTKSVKLYLNNDENYYLSVKSNNSLESEYSISVMRASYLPNLSYIYNNGMGARLFTTSTRKKFEFLVYQKETVYGDFYFSEYLGINSGRKITINIYNSNGDIISTNSNAISTYTPFAFSAEELYFVEVVIDIGSGAYNMRWTTQNNNFINRL